MAVLLTGASGFLGKYIRQELLKTGEIISLSKNDATINSDLAINVPNLPAVKLVVHCAGRAHSVPKNELEKKAFFNVNVNGTANLLQGLEKAACLPQSFIFISSVAVYGCQSGILIKEDHPLNAKDPYGQSKIEAEQLVQNWCQKHDVLCSVLRLPLLVGKNPPGNLGAMIKGIKRGYYFNVAGGKAHKSMVLAADVAQLIPIVAKIGGIYNLTDGYHPSFSRLSNTLAKQMSKGKLINIPFWMAKLLGFAGDLFGNYAPFNSNKLNKLTSDLTFDDCRARELLNWNPESVLNGFLI